MAEHKNDILRLSASALLLILGVMRSYLPLPEILIITTFAAAYIIAGFEVLIESAKNIIKGEIFDENFLMSIASIGAFAIGQYAEAVFVMLFYGVGELFEHIATDKSRKSIKAITKIRPDTARLLTENGDAKVKAEEIKIGDVILVNPGETIPLDGVVTEGESTVDTCAVTGESVPLHICVSDIVYSGCINLSGAIKVRVTAEFKDSTASKILDLVENAENKKAKTQRFITQFARYYTPIVVILAVLTAVIPSVITKQYNVWIYRALMFLVVSCPCALVVSVPLTYFASIGSAAKQGVLIKGADALETLSRIDTVVFDKTGTLTKGTFSVVAVHPQKVDKKKLLEIAACVEYNSNHPVSLSLKAAYGKLPEKINISDVCEIAGQGVKAVLDGKTLLAGNGKLMVQNGIEFKECHCEGTIVHIACEGEYLGHIVVSDTLKPQSGATISKLKNMGIKTVMLTGDGKRQGEYVAQALDINEYYSELLPQEKVEKTEAIISSGRKVAFAGDGINDAPVIATADVGISMGALGSDAAVEAADIVLMDDNPKKIVSAIKHSIKTSKIVRQNIFFSIAVKIIIMILSITGICNMWVASFADVGVLVIAVFNALRALRI